MAPARYFPETEPRLTALLDGFLASLAADLEKQPFSGGVRVLLLAGGYGRGEGGIFLPSGGGASQLYNDLEFYLILSAGGSMSAAEQWCARQSHLGDEALGIEVEFKILREEAFISAAPSMFYYDLLSAHRVVFGRDDFAAGMPSRLSNPEVIPPHEATRLLFNRGTGLFYSRIALLCNSARVANGFIERNHAKARLALADAVLALNGRYHFSCRERHARLGESLGKTPPLWDTVAAWHREGVEFKLHPRHRQPSLAQLEPVQSEICRVWMSTFLWLESQRIGVEFREAADYAAHGGRLFPESGAMRNLALHIRDRLKRGAALPGRTDYPRAALQRALVLCLQPQPAFVKAARYLNLKADAAPETIQSAYEHWWKYYN